MESSAGRVGIVIVTKDRRDRILATLARIEALSERWPTVVVDNASTDGTAQAVEDSHPGVTVVRLPANLGAAGRNCGAALVGTPYVAFSDDDSWWAAGSLGRAVELFDTNPRLGLVAARVLVGADERPDPVCTAMAASPLRTAGGPGRSVLGFVACGSVVRRSAFLHVGGFRLGYGIGGEEELLAIDLSAAGWDLRYCPELSAHHHPATSRPPLADRRRRQLRNALRTAWLRDRPLGVASRTVKVAGQARLDSVARLALRDLAGDLSWLWHERRPVSRRLAADLHRL